MNIIKFISVAVVLFASNGIMYAQSTEGFGHGMRHGGNGAQHGAGRMKKMKWFNDLNLTSEQMKKINTIRTSKMEKMHSLRDELNIRKSELVELMSNGENDDRIREKNNQIRNVQKQMQDFHLETMLDINRVLNAEQRKIFAQKMLQAPWQEEASQK